ncbi:response regulator containing a CheY-like receiver domain and an HTH DNA-binding domain [Mycolicibacterium chubuense NBB4]|uniref:Response regulator containing a CheY-like receiver domain and an HTH DNA-binding domain n=1 Tax=Mycolicibacterium chubuense (strain NBB4) TaxID=710421 RepID=I4BPX2_MYCCN|nr:response regulator transcription factor [Mycolicibacterium chubuense]AFM19329.1 response regulator containing a CheY-like receiver domain and an HTH DNA-binding domain [Mycolicibacterium chubuense NBB4]
MTLLGLRPDPEAEQGSDSDDTRVSRLSSGSEPMPTRRIPARTPEANLARLVGGVAVSNHQVVAPKATVLTVAGVAQGSGGQIISLPPPDSPTSIRTDKNRSLRGKFIDGDILIVDDCTLHRESLATVLSLRGIATVRVASDLPTLVAALEGSEPRVILLNMDSRGVQRFLRAMSSLSTRAGVIVIAASLEDESAIIACAEAGVAAYHMRTDSFSHLIALIERVAAGEVSCPAAVSAILLRHLSSLASRRDSGGRDLVLTTRETQILQMLELGRSNQDIAAHLSIAVHTVKNHVHNLLTKLGVSTRAEAAALSHAVRRAGQSQGTRSGSSQNWP